MHPQRAGREPQGWSLVESIGSALELRCLPANPLEMVPNLADAGFAMSKLSSTTWS